VVKESAGRLVMEVSDTGIGIAPDEQERIFEKFYRAKDPRVGKITGSGLGLALAREVARFHGGDVTVQSEVDKGSMFTLVLPVTAAPAASKAA
jgi:signal transduction histidine kinase